MNSNILDNVNSPEDLKKLDSKDLPKLCEEIRELLINSVSKTGGHLSSNLGVVELTVALHRMFNSPDDSIIWDVGHQCYPHKILTGRKDKMNTLRQFGGISGFPKPYESEHDCFVGGHSSTSLSAAHGIAVANLASNNSNYVVAVIGDGALSGGQAYEALNTLGRSGTRSIVVINNNGMSISKNVSGISKYLSTIRTSRDYLNFKKGINNSLVKIPLIGTSLVKLIEWGKKIIKTTLYHTTFFEELGFVYYGQVDGHNLKNLDKTFRAIKNIDAPVVIQVSTVKGKGYAPAEENPGGYHGVAKFDCETGNPDVECRDSYSSVMGEELVRLAGMDKDIYAITAAMKYATGLKNFSTLYRDRFFDVGIAEQHAVTLAGGLASRGKKPVFAVYSTFLQRAIDQVINDCAIGEQHIVLAIDRAGIVGEDGETHNGIFDISLLSAVPNIKIYSPLCYEELKLTLNKAILEDKNISAVRYPRGNQKNVVGEDYKNSFKLDSTNAFSYINNDNRKLVISYGAQFMECYNAVQLLQKQGEEFDMIKLLQIVPLTDKVLTLALQYRTIYFVEETAAVGGIGMQMLAKLMSMGFDGVFKIKAIDNTIVKHGSVAVIKDELGLSAKKLCSFLMR